MNVALVDEDEETTAYRILPTGGCGKGGEEMSKLSAAIDFGGDDIHAPVA